MKIPGDAVWVTTGDITWVRLRDEWHPSDGGQPLSEDRVQQLVTNLDSNGLSVVFFDKDDQVITP